MIHKHSWDPDQGMNSSIVKLQFNKIDERFKDMEKKIMDWTRNVITEMMTTEMETCFESK